MKKLINFFNNIMENRGIGFINKKKKEVQEKILRYLEEDNEEESNNDKQFQDLIQYFSDPTKFIDYIGHNKEILIMINNIANHHYRTPQFFPKIEKLLIGIQESIKKHILPNNIYFSFKNNKRILLFLIQNKIIEYAAFYGSIKIFNFLRMNGAKIEPFLMKFAVHSNNADMILLAEQFVDKEDLSAEDFYQLSFDETLKCHNFRQSEYFINKFVNYPKLDKSVKWLNYEYFPNTIGESVFYYICKNDICELFSKELASNRQIVIYCYRAAKMMNNVGIMQAIKDINICSNYTFEKSVQVYQDSFVVELTFYDLPPIPYVTKVVIQPNAEGFYTNIFTNCPHMEEIVFKKPSSLKCLNNGVFYGMIYLKEIKIPASVKSIGNFAFGRCNALK